MACNLHETLDLMDTYKKCLKTVERMVDSILEDGLKNGDQWVAGVQREITTELETCAVYKYKVDCVSYDDGGFKDHDFEWSQWCRDHEEADHLSVRVRFRARDVFRVWQRVERYNKLVNVFFELENI